MIAFVASPAGVTATFTRSESLVLRDLAEQLIELLEERATDATGDVLYAQLGIGGASAPPLDPALARLLPDAYRGDEHAASDHRRLTERSLVERKVSNARRLIADLATRQVKLDDVSVQSWLRTLTDLRLALAARLQIETDGDIGLGDEDMLIVYDWLGYLQGIARGGDRMISDEVDAARFEQLVIDELDLLPDDMVDGLDNVVFVTEDRPEDGSLDLLGLYDGIALTERGSYGFGELPDRIILYREPLLAVSESLEELQGSNSRHSRTRDRPLLRARRRAASPTRLGLMSTRYPVRGNPVHRPLDRRWLGPDRVPV